ncbi:acyl-[ACP]--phospholipid O-acyltransferase [Celerinatantimonas sp. MCCC 1A17872]|uniref:acyl-[ACP]--phospholipid O-acyltransferase n=1 Tax=Celerinatantimonas sp. MCCC 1A17872 TaxID=3177514 RepID=UPI0038C97E57
MKSLIRSKGFAAYIVVAFLNAFVDLGHKIIIQNTLFKSFDGSVQIELTAIVNALILLPFILLFTPAGFISDRFKKQRVMQLSSAACVLITVLITWCYYQGHFIGAFILTFLLALQSAIYSPAKYGYIRDLIGVERLSEGNGWIQAVTMVAILGSIVMFSALFESLLPAAASYTPTDVLHYVAPLGWALVALASFEFLTSLTLKDTQTHVRPQPFNWQKYAKGQTLRANLRLLASNKAIWQSVLGLTLFWALSQVMLAVFPAYGKAYLGIDNTFVLQGIMALSGIGIIVGSMLANKVSREQINLALIPVGIAGVALGLVALVQTQSLTMLGGEFFIIGMCGALFCVPLNALVQFNAKESQLGSVLAGNNFIQNIGMLAFLALTVLFSLFEFNMSYLLWALAVLAVVATVVAIIVLPEALLKTLVSALLGRKYRLKVLGLKNLQQDQQGILLLGNHISWLDWAMIQMACPRHIHFVMDRSIYQRWYCKWFFDLYKVIPISGTQSRDAMTQISELLNQGEVVCLFPEGAISHLGQLGEFKRGYEKACENASGVIIPFYLRGLWGSTFSRSSEKLTKLRSQGLKRDVVIAFGQPLSIQTKADELKQHVFDLSVSTWNEYADTLEPIAQSWIQTAKAKPTDWALVDSKGEPQSHQRLLTMSALMHRQIKRLPGQNLALLVPTSVPGLVANMAGLMAGKTIVNINYTSAKSAQMNALEQAQIQSVVTSRMFIKKLQKRGVDCEQLLADKEVLYLEDFAKNVRKSSAFMTALMAKILPTSALKLLWCPPVSLDDSAAILFSSGSEGAPKGVMLSHRNIMANMRQVSDVLNVQSQDRVMATLPLFHAFGLTVTGLMPMIEGIPAVCHPDPTDGLNIAKAITKYQATIMCATSTFLRLYIRNRRIHPLMLQSLRAVVSGAEKLDPQVRNEFAQRFGKTVLEGYGTTETTPVASVNLPGYIDPETAQVQEAARQGSVGMALPGTTFRIVEPNTLEPLSTGEDGLILIGGAQIMKGYLNNPEKTAEVIVELDGLRWYKTGDKGHLDEDGYLHIVDRYSRFAKLAGEMVSLGAIEQQVKTIMNEPYLGIIAVNLPDEKKGEKVVLLTTSEMTPEQFRAQLIEHKMPALMVPSEIIQVDELPILGSGKVDFKAAKQLALANR